VIGALAYFGTSAAIFAVAWVLYRNHAAELDRRRLVRGLNKALELGRKWSRD
jgi:hypothetical protein